LRKIAVSLSKGGVAKTTTAVNLAAHLAQEARVLLIDCDTQAQCSKMLGVQPVAGPVARLADLLLVFPGEDHQTSSEKKEGIG
jgi:cellulose biosynthesis protein BcsQ